MRRVKIDEIKGTLTIETDMDPKQVGYKSRFSVHSKLFNISDEQASKILAAVLEAMDVSTTKNRPVEIGG